MYSKTRTSSPTSIPNDLGYYKRVVANQDLDRIRTVRVRGIDRVADPVLYAPFNAVGTITVGYETGSGNIMSLSITGFYLPVEQVPLMTEWETFSSCGCCKGSNGGCPGFAPMFKDIMMRSLSVPDTDNVFVIVVTIDMIWAIKYAYSGRQAIMNRVCYADRLTDCYLARLSKHIGIESSNKYLSSGNCKGCSSPKKCSVIVGGLCNNPTKRTFSLEATGVDVDEIHHMLYGEYLPWYYRGTRKVPTYMSRYAMFMADPYVDYESLLKKFVLEDKSYCDTGLVVRPGDVQTELLGVPQGVHAGIKQWVYRL
jgi:hypothetical protein